jgi:hypothetical protein
MMNLQGDSRGMLNILGGDRISHFENKFIETCYWFWLVIETQLFECGMHCLSLFPLWCVKILVCATGWRAKYTNERWRYKTNSFLAIWMLLPAWRNVKKRLKMNNMQSSHTSYIVHWSSQWDFWTFIANFNKCVIPV